MKITPAILPHTFEEISEKVSLVDGFVSKIQIDICDGVFGREKTWLPNGDEMLPSGFAYEFDVMVDDWRKYVPLCIKVGAKFIVAHVDLFKDGDMEDLVSMVAPSSISLGISVSNDKSVEFHEDMVRKAQDLYPHIFIQVMGIKQIGEQGQTFDNDAVNRVKSLKQNFGNVLLQVDGGMILETANLVREAGAETVVVGSYVFGSTDPATSVGAISSLGE